MGPASPGKTIENQMRVRETMAATTIETRAYAPARGEWGLIDHVQPPRARSNLAALVIHGGGWNAMDKSSLHPLAALVAKCGLSAWCPNYRLVDAAPWPACGDDCLAAARFILNGAAGTAGHVKKPASLILAGASAGAHLALMTGLRLPPGTVRGILAIAGPVDIEALLTDPNGALKLKPETFFGTRAISSAMWNAASPLSLLAPGAPELFCIHSRNDRLVPPSHSVAIRHAARAVGVTCEVAWFDGRDDAHGCWRPAPPGTPLSKRQFLPEIEACVRNKIRSWMR